MQTANSGRAFRAHWTGSANVAGAHQPDTGQSNASLLDKPVDNHLQDRINSPRLAHGQGDRLQELQVHCPRLYPFAVSNNGSSLRPLNSWSLWGVRSLSSTV